MTAEAEPAQPAQPQKSTPRAVGWIFAAWVGVITALTLPLSLINPVVIGLLQDRHDVADKVRIPQEELDRINGEIVWDLFSSGDFEMTFDSGEPVLDAAERSHMQDASRLLRILVLLDVVALGFAAWGGRLLRTEKRRLGRMLIAGSGFVGIAVILIGVFAVVAWDTAFTLFHEILFPPGTWSFPPTSTMIQLYGPPGFWFDGAMIGGALILLTAAALSYAGLRRIREATD